MARWLGFSFVVLDVDSSWKDTITGGWTRSYEDRRLAFVKKINDVVSKVIDAITLIVS